MQSNLDCEINILVLTCLRKVITLAQVANSKPDLRGLVMHSLLNTGTMLTVLHITLSNMYSLYKL